MSVGTVLVGIALLVVVVAYVARPFRGAARGPDPAKAIEVWVARIRQAEDTGLRTEGPPSAAEQVQPINYCAECGRRVASDDRFCSGCGTKLRGEAS